MLELVSVQLIWASTRNAHLTQLYNSDRAAEMSSIPAIYASEQVAKQCSLSLLERVASNYKEETCESYLEGNLGWSGSAHTGVD